MRLLSDFDGVWTDPIREGATQGEVMESTVREWAAADGRDDVAVEYARVREHAMRTPARYGWLSDGKLSAFADEDPFAPHNALLHVVHERSEHDAFAAWFVERAARGGHAGLDDFGAAMHYSAVGRVEASHGPGVLPSAAAAGRRMLERAVDVVMVSNSITAKLERWFGAAGLPYRVHPERADGVLRLRGSARKYVLAGAGERLMLGSLAIEVGRPRYRALLEEERPDAVVGDVFSIDLALPLWLKRTARGFEHVRLFWLQRAYTPTWLRALVATHAPEVEMLDDGLPGVANRLVGAE